MSVVIEERGAVFMYEEATFCDSFRKAWDVIGRFQGKKVIDVRIYPPRQDPSDPLGQPGYIAVKWE